MTKSEPIPVLIIGAGPTGLMAACQLARFQIPFRIIDKKSGPTKESRAVVIQARSLEIFKQMGIAGQVNKKGKEIHAIHFFIGDKEKRIPVGKIGENLTEFPYLFVLEQSKTEEILGNYLSENDRIIEWETELVSFTQTSDKISATVRKKGGKEDIVASYLIAADGSHSLVRKTLQIPFAGASYKQAFYVLDCAAQGLPEENALYLAMTRKNFTGLFPMTKGRVRVIATVPKEYEQKESVTFADIAPSLRTQLPDMVRLSNPDWISLYHIHHRRVATFSLGRCFLAGDAAHIHSPAGAQGMNTGLQDAYNLAWKLAYVLQKKAPESLLETYNAERLPFAKRLMKTTDRMFSFLIDERPWQTFLRLQVLPRVLSLLLKTGYIKKVFFPAISQIGINYRKSISYYSTSFGRFDPEAPRPGDRFPYSHYQNESGQTYNLQDRIDGKKFHIFIFSKSNNRDFVHRVYSAVKENKDIMVHQIVYSNRTKKLYTLFGIEESVGFYIVRPDMYIAYRCSGFNGKHLQKFLDTVFLG